MNPEEKERAYDILPPSVMLAIDFFERHRILFALAGPALLGLIHVSGFLTMIFHLKSRGIRFGTVELGAEAFLVGSIHFMFVCWYVLIFVALRTMVIQLGRLSSDLTRLTKARWAFARELPKEQRLSGFFWNLESSRPWKRFLKRNSPPIGLGAISAYFIWISIRDMPKVLASAFPGIDFMRDGVYGVAIFWVIMFTILEFLHRSMWRGEAPAQVADESATQYATAFKVVFAIYSILLIGSCLFNSVTTFATRWYPKMIAEFGGGRATVATMVFDRSSFCHLKLDQEPLGPLIDMPGTSDQPKECSRLVRIVYEDDATYRISALVEQVPPVIHTIKKEYVTLVSISPQKP